MKTINRKTVLLAGLCALAFSFGTVAYGEKGSEALVRLTKSAPPATTEAAPDMAHKCSTCTDTFVTDVDKSTKGPNHLVTKAVRHNCAACSTTITTEGNGKAARDVATHNCGAVTKPTCCTKS
jgi:hypothetical protein